MHNIICINTNAGPFNLLKKITTVVKKRAKGGRYTYILIAVLLRKLLGGTHRYFLRYVLFTHINRNVKANTLSDDTKVV